MMFGRFFLLVQALLLAGCVGLETERDAPLQATREVLQAAGQNQEDAAFIEQLLRARTWVSHRRLSADPVELGKAARIPIQHETIKVLGPTTDDALNSLAAKIWLIEHAEHTIDVVYYIFKPDLVGQAMLGALCNAVKRGVDVRIMVDSIGSISLLHSHLLALESCASDAGYMRTADGRLTPHKARVQAVVFNAILSTTSWINRRSHDKLLVVDGAFPRKTMVMTGGRNISLDYYGIKADGSLDPAAYRDLEILIRPDPGEQHAPHTVGNVSETYFTLLFLHRGNRLLHPSAPEHEEDYDFLQQDPYQSYRQQAQQALRRLKGFALMTERLADMPVFMAEGFHEAQVRLAHELANLTNRNVVTNTGHNLAGNPNSIMHLVDEYSRELGADSRLRIVSPYLFMARYYDRDGKLVADNVADTHEWLQAHPDGRIEIVTNSVLTSDNFLAQAVIDMDVGPRMLLPPDLEQAWLNSELDGKLIESQAWKSAINHPQIFIYQTGKLDAALLGKGRAHYGKLHAKFIVGEEGGFVGTSNFDYRSRLFNNELGFFYESEAVSEELNAIFEQLKASSYRWGSPEWLQMRHEVMALGGIKGWSTRHQRAIFSLMRSLGLEWLI